MEGQDKQRLQFEEEKRHIIAELTEEKSAHMRTIQELQGEKKNSEQLVKQVAEMAHLRTSFEESQKLMIQAQKKLVEERNKNLVSSDKIIQLSNEIEILRTTNDKTQSILEQNLEELEEKRAVIESNPSLEKLDELQRELLQTQRQMKKLQDEHNILLEEHNKITENLATSALDRDVAIAERQELVIALENANNATAALQKKLDEAHFDLEISNESVAALQRQLAAANITPTTGEGSDSASIEELKATLLTTETRLARLDKQLNAFRQSASQEARKHQERISELQHQLQEAKNATPTPTPIPNGIDIHTSAEVENLRLQLSAEQQSNEEMQKMLAHLRDNSDVQGAKLASEQEEKQLISHQLQELQTQHNALVMESEQERVQYEKFKEDVQMERSAMKELRLYNDKLTQELTKLGGSGSTSQNGVGYELQAQLDIVTDNLHRERALAADLKGSNDTLRKEVEREKAATEEAGLFRNVLKTQVDILNQECNEAQAKIQQLEAQLAAHGPVQPTEVELRMKQLESERDASERTISDLGLLNQELEQRITDFTQQLQAHEGQAQDQQNELALEIERLRTELEAATADTARSEGARETLSKELADTNGVLEVMRKELDQNRCNEDDVQLIRKELFESQATNTRIAQELVDMSTAVTTLESQLSTQQARLAAEEAAHRALQQAYEKLLQETENDKQKSDEKNNTAEEVQEEVAELQRQLADLQVQYDQVLDELKIEREKEDEAIDQSIQHEGEIRALQSQNNKILHELAESLKAQKQLQQQLAEAQTTDAGSAQMSEQYEELVQKNESLTSELREKQDANTQWQAKAEGFEKELQHQIARADDLQEEYNLLVQDLKKEKETSKVGKNGSEAALQSLQQKCDGLEKQLKDRTSVAQRAESELAQLEVTLKVTERELDDAKEKLSQLSEEHNKQQLATQAQLLKFENLLATAETKCNELKGELRTAQSSSEICRKYDVLVREQEETEHLLDELWKEKESLRSETELWQQKYEGLRSREQYDDISKLRKKEMQKQLQRVIQRVSASPLSGSTGTEEPVIEGPPKLSAVNSNMSSNSLLAEFEWQEFQKDTEQLKQLQWMHRLTDLEDELNNSRTEKVKLEQELTKLRTVLSLNSTPLLQVNGYSPYKTASDVNESTELHAKLAQLEQLDPLNISQSDDDFSDSSLRKQSQDLELKKKIVQLTEECEQLREALQQVKEERDNLRQECSAHERATENEKKKAAHENELLKDQLKSLHELKAWSDRLKEHIDKQREENMSLVATINRLKDQNEKLKRGKPIQHPNASRIHHGRHHSDSVLPNRIPDTSRSFITVEDSMMSEDLGDDMESVIYEDQQAAHEHASNIMLSQINTLLEHVRATRTKERNSYKSQIVRLRHQLATEREEADNMRNKYEEEHTKLQRDTLEALKNHIQDIKSVYTESEATSTRTPQ